MAVFNVLVYKLHWSRDNAPQVVADAEGTEQKNLTLAFFFFFASAPLCSGGYLDWPFVTCYLLIWLDLDFNLTDFCPWL